MELGVVEKDEEDTREAPRIGHDVRGRGALEREARVVRCDGAQQAREVDGGGLGAFQATVEPGELHEVVRTARVDDELIRERKDAFRSYQTLTPPRVLTSDGEVIAGSYRRVDVPAGALVGSRPSRLTP